MSDPLAEASAGAAHEPLHASATAVAEQPAPTAQDRAGIVAVTGAAGFVGSRVCQTLAERGWRVRALVHNPVRAATRLGHLPVELRIGDIRDATFVRDAFAGAAAVVHLAAIAIETRGATYEAVNASATRVVLDCARDAGATRFVHMSQNGSDSRSPYAFLRSKGEAQDMVTSSALRWTVLRPSVIFGPRDEFVNVLARLVRLTPFVYPLPDGGRARFQPIAVGDVARVIARSLDDENTVGGIYQLGGPVPLTLREMTERILVAMRARRYIMGVPTRMLRPLVALAQRILPRPPVTTELMNLLALDNTVPDNAITTTFGIVPMPFAPEELYYLRRITLRSALASLLARR